MTQDVVFLFRPRLRHAGSKIMRCDQLAGIGDRFLADRYAFSVQVLPRLESDGARRDFAAKLTGKIVILLKGTASVLGDAGMEMLRARTRGLAIDYVDAHARRCYSPFADLHIAASRAGEVILRRLLADNGSADGRADVVCLTHHYDPRLEELAMRDPGRVRAAYLGHPRNTIVPDAIAARVTRLDSSGRGGISQAFAALCDYNLHYAVRPPDHAESRAQDVAKPFTKGFIAAALGALVLTTRDTDDAELLLGPDYPFLVDDCRPGTLAAALDHAAAIHGTPQWQEARDRMRHLRDLASPWQVARELDAILSRLRRSPEWPC